MFYYLANIKINKDYIKFTLAKAYKDALYKLKTKAILFYVRT